MHDVCHGSVVVGAAGDDEPGMVVQDGEDSYSLVACDGPVTVVHLPCFVGLICLKSNPWAARTLLWLGDDVTVVC